MKPKTFKKLSCNPKHKKTRKNHTCYDDKTLLILRDVWNKKHPENKIISNENESIWKELQQNLTECNHEICFMEKLVDSQNDTEKFKKEFFAPIAPKSWNKNINEWLSSIDIKNVLNQYEETYSDFKFIGPTPIDFDEYIEHSCVYPELCNINVKKMYDTGIRKFGIIFNLSSHNEKGTHWVSLFTDLNKQFIFYFDSCGDDIPKEIKTLIKKIINQSKMIGIKLKEDNNIGVVHQMGDTECGMYSLYFIINLIEEIKSKDDFKKGRITDEEVQSFRHFYFNVLMDD
jgi:hypothetical protein